MLKKEEEDVFNSFANCVVSPLAHIPIGHCVIAG